MFTRIWIRLYRRRYRNPAGREAEAREAVQAWGIPWPKTQRLGSMSMCRGSSFWMDEVS